MGLECGRLCNKVKQSEINRDLTVFLPMCHYPTVSFYSIVEYKL